MKSERAITAAIVLLLAACEPTAGPSTIRAVSPAEELVGRAVPTVEDNQPPPPGARAVTAAALESEPCPQRPIREYASRMIKADMTSAKFWPGFASLIFVSPDGRRTVFECGGVLLDSTTVLTAAHCFNDASRGTDGQIRGTRAGSGADTKGYRLAVSANHDDVADIATAPRSWAKSYAFYTDAAGRSYDGSLGHANDIAVVKLETPLEKQKYAMLAGAMTADPRLPGHLVWAAGFGLTESNVIRTIKIPYGAEKTGGEAKAGSSVLQDAIVQLQDAKACRDTFGSAFNEARQVCAGWSIQGRDTCTGDSGGPLIVLDSKSCPVVIGLTSAGKADCGGNDSYGFYTRISAYRDWIVSQAAAPRFSTETPPVVGPEETSALVQALVERAAKSPGGLTVTMGPERGRVFDAVDGRYTVKAYSRLMLTVKLDKNVSGKVLIFQRTNNGRYSPLFPKRDTPAQDVERVRAAGSTFELGAAADGKAQWQAGLQRYGASESNDLVALVVPQQVKVGKLILFENLVSRGAAAESATQSPPAYGEAMYIGALLSQSGLDPKVGAISAYRLTYVVNP